MGGIKVVNSPVSTPFNPTLILSFKVNQRRKNPLEISQLCSFWEKKKKMSLFNWLRLCDQVPNTTCPLWIKPGQNPQGHFCPGDKQPLTLDASLLTFVSGWSTFAFPSFFLSLAAPSLGPLTLPAGWSEMDEGGRWRFCRPRPCSCNVVASRNSGRQLHVCSAAENQKAAASLCLFVVGGALWPKHKICDFYKANMRAIKAQEKYTEILCLQKINMNEISWTKVEFPNF